VDRRGSSGIIQFISFSDLRTQNRGTELIHKRAMQSVVRCPQICVPRHGCTVERFIFIPSRAVARYKRRCDNDQAPRPLSTVIFGSSQYLLSQCWYCPINVWGQTTARVLSTDAPGPPVQCRCRARSRPGRNGPVLVARWRFLFQSKRC
jgi:hypothetical protein